MSEPPAPPDAASRIWVASELYYPEETSTGFILTHIAEGLAESYPVHALCVQPTYSRRGTQAPAQEVRHGVRITRRSPYTLDNRRIVNKLFNISTISASLFFAALTRLKASDRVLVVTNPPLLPFLMALACRLRGARYSLLIHDVYPEIMAASGMIDLHSLPARVLSALNRRLYNGADKVIVLGRDMKALAEEKLRPENRDRVFIIPNWADSDEIAPAPKEENPLLRELGLEGKFVALYAGNLGMSHNVDALAEAIKKLAALDPDAHFIFLGGGSRRPRLEAAVREGGLTNVTLLSGRPRSDQPVFLNACDVSIISLAAGMSGVSVPSRTYNVLAAGKPIIAFMEEDAEVAQIIKEEGVGWVVPPDRPDRLAAAILEAKADPERLAKMGARAREVAVRKYSKRAVVESYKALFR